MQKPILTVSEINKYIKDILSTNVILSNVLVRGEISNYKYHYSGHMYFTLKDECSTIKCVMFKTSSSMLKFEPCNGMKVITTGRVSVYERDGSYQIYIDEMQPDGVGALHLAFEQLKNKLEAEGLFDANRKKTLPVLPKTVGIVTSPTGAAIKDILNILSRRFYNLKIVISPVLVQGEGAGEQIAKAIKNFNKLNNVDVIIMGRGGGSIEELWVFNEEVVARSVALSNIPVISAVGHETDYTICDFVSDLRAPTPSAAAELVVPNKTDLRTTINNLNTRLNYAIENYINKKRTYLQSLKTGSTINNPLDVIYRYRINLDMINKEIIKDIKYNINNKKMKLEQLHTNLLTLSPLNILRRGYSISSLNNSVIKSINKVNIGDSIKIQLCDGYIDCIITDKNKGDYCEK